MKKQKFTPGAIVKVQFEESCHIYGQLLMKPYVAFYDFKVSDDQSNLREIVEKPVLFILCVFDHAITKGRWEIIGKVSFEENNIEIPLQFIQDSYPPYNCFLIDASGNMRPASIDQCRGLERSSVWEPEHVEERLRDFYASRINRWVESLKYRE